MYRLLFRNFGMLYEYDRATEAECHALAKQFMVSCYDVFKVR